MTDEMEYNLDNVIVIADQENLIKTLIKNLALLRAEACHCTLIDEEFESNLHDFNAIANDLLIKLQVLLNFTISEKLELDIKSATMEFVETIYRSWEQMIEKVSEEYPKFYVASRTVYGVALTLLLTEIKKEAAAINISLQIGELLYDKEYLIKGYMYYNELIKLLNTLEGCDEKVQHLLMISEASKHLKELDLMIDKFASKMNFLSIGENNSGVFSNISKLLTGELLGLDPIDPSVVLMENAPKKPVFITKNNRRTQLKSLQHLPLFSYKLE